MTTLDGVERVLDDGELLICDEQGPIALAGVMGGQRAEWSATTTSVLLEAAHFAPVRVTMAARRHKLPSEAAKRYERGVDHALAPAAAQVAVQNGTAVPTKPAPQQDCAPTFGNSDIFGGSYLDPTP